MNRYLMIGRSNLGSQKVDVHAVATFRCDLMRAWKWVSNGFR